MSPDLGRLWAVSDQGWWLRADLRSNSAGAPLGLEAARLGPLLDPRGQVLQGKRNRDAEGLAARGGGFGELRAQPPPVVLSPAPGPGRAAGALSLPPWLTASPKNSGVEAVSVLADGRILLLAEDSGRQGRTTGALGDGQGWQKISYRLHADFKPTALAPLPGGGCLVLERAYNPVLGARARLGWLPPEGLRSGAELVPVLLADLAPPLATDNFEGLAVVPEPAGGLRVYLLSDDNYFPLQRTLLLAFRLPPGPWR